MYEPIDAIMLRTPVWPIEKFRELQGLSPLKQTLSDLVDHSFSESIAVASSTLYNDLPALQGDRKNSRKTNQVVSSVFKYAGRMSTRPTPFGLFAGVTAGELGESTDVSLKGDQHHQKRARPDMGWLLALVAKLEKNVEGMDHICVFTNPLAFRVGGRVFLAYATDYGKQSHTPFKQEKISIQASEPVIKVLELSQQPILFSDLVKQMVRHYPGVEQDQIKSFVLQLLGQEFLISELRPPLTIKNPFQYIMKKIESISPYSRVYRELSEIDNMIGQYNATPLGEGLPVYLKLTKRMEKINQTRSPLQVDLTSASKKVVLNKGVAEEAATAVKILWRISQTQKGLPHLIKYKNRFLDRYGRNREVPILELLSEESGLGPPEEYDADHGTHNEELRDDQREQTLLRLMQSTLLHKKYVVNLDDGIIAKLKHYSIDEGEAPLTAELYAEVLAKNEQAVDEGEFTLVIAPNPGSGAAGQTFGRFMDILDDSVQKK